MFKSLVTNFELFSYSVTETEINQDIYYIDDNFWVEIDKASAISKCTPDEIELILGTFYSDKKIKYYKSFDYTEDTDPKIKKVVLYNLSCISKAISLKNPSIAIQLNQWMDEIKVGIIKRRGSNAFIYEDAYHLIYKDIVESKQLNTYTRAPVLMLVAFNIELALKSIIMLKTGQEPWKSGGHGHDLNRLFYMMPEQERIQCFRQLGSASFDKKESQKFLTTTSNAFIEYRYNYETDDSIIDERTELFLKTLWQIIYGINREAETFYQLKEV